MGTVFNVKQGGTNADTTSGARDNLDVYSKAESLTLADLYKYRIVTSVSSGNLTVALKNYLGDDPSASVPVKVQIGDTVRTVTSALSVPIGGNVQSWFNAGSAELATKEIDYFVYLKLGTVTGSVDIGVSRIPYATRQGDFALSNQGENEKHLRANYFSDLATDPVTNIGRFNATLSASPYNWSIPATSVVINRPVYETRALSAISVLTGFSDTTTGTIKYKLVGDICYILGDNSFEGTSNATNFNFTTVFKSALLKNGALSVYVRDNGSNLSAPGHLQTNADSNTVNVGKTFYLGEWTSSGVKAVFLQNFNYNI